MTTMTPPDDSALMRAAGFSVQDLEANRRGRLSERQDYVLRQRRIRTALIGMAVVLVGVFIASGLLFFGSRQQNVILSLVGIGFTLCNAMMAGLFVRHWLRLNGDIRGGVVIATSGTLERVVKPVSRRVVNTMLRVGDVEVFVSKELFEATAHRLPYTLYRAPATGTLLALERVDSPDSA